MRWLAPPLVMAGLLWAFIQFAFTAFAASVARGDQLTQCGQDLDYGLLTGLTAAVVILALASLGLALARRPHLAVLAIASEALLALIWWTSDTAGGGVGCAIG
jgi:hypothetical protein